MAKIEFFEDEAINQTYVTLLILLIEADQKIIYDAMGMPFNEKEQKRLNRKGDAERELIRLGYWDQDGRYVNSDNIAFSAAQRWFEAHRLGV